MANDNDDRDDVSNYQIVGVSLVTEEQASNTDSDVHLGIVKLTKNQNVSAIRKLICARIVTLPTSFVFVTKERLKHC